MVDPCHISFLDEERERVKRLQIPPEAKIECLPPISTERTFALRGSVAPSSSDGKSPQFHPVLPSLNSIYTNPMPHFLQCLTEHEELMHDTIDVMKMRTDHSVQESKTLRETFQATLQEEIKTAQFEKKWGVWETVLQYAMGTGSLLLGMGLLAVNDDSGAGVCLIAAGGLGLTNQFLIDTNGWQTLVQYFVESTEKQKAIVAGLQSGMFFLSMSLTLTGLALAERNDALSNTLPKERIIKIYNTSTAVLQAGTKLGKEAIRHHSFALQATMIRTQARITDHRKTLNLLASNQQEQFEIHERISEIVKKAIQQLSVSD